MTYLINNNITRVTNVIICKCEQIYVGSTIRPLRGCILEHIWVIKNADKRYPLTTYFNICKGNRFKQIRFDGIHHIPFDPSRAEAKWILKLAVEIGHNRDPEINYFWGESVLPPSLYGQGTTSELYSVIYGDLEWYCDNGLL